MHSASSLKNNIDGKTVSIFISPRVKLCKQQNDSIERFISSHSSLRRDQDYTIIAIDNTNQQFNRNDDVQSQHVIFVFCEASLWGGVSEDEADAAIRWNRWTGKLKHWAEDFGYKLGVIFYDEAHNYERKVDKIMKLSEMFKLTMLASGTPAFYQRDLSKKWRKNVCECSPAEAMEQKMICTPSLNLVYGNANIDFPYAIKAVLEREKKISEHEVFKTAVLVNCSSIDQIKSILDHSWMKDGIGKDFHVISIHSSKAYSQDNACLVLDSRIDCQSKKSEEAYDAIEKLDSGYFNDSLPVIVFQVGMIGEGINVKCFNSVIITTHSDRTAMQQIGRAVRNCEKDGKSKVNDGHANVYAFFENVGDLQQLIINLQSYDLTDSCYDWGKQIDVSTGSGIDHNDENDTLSGMNDFNWSDFDTIDIQEIMRAADIKFTNRKNDEFVDEFIEENSDLVMMLIDAMKDSGYEELLDKNVVNAVKRCDATKIADEAKMQKERRAERHLDDEASCRHAQRDEERATPHLVLTKDIIIDMLVIIQQYARTHKKTFKLMIDTAGLERTIGTIFGNDIIGMIFSKILEQRPQFIGKLVSR